MDEMRAVSIGSPVPRCSPNDTEEELQDRYTPPSSSSHASPSSCGSPSSYPTIRVDVCEKRGPRTPRAISGADREDANKLSPLSTPEDDHPLRLGGGLSPPSMTPPSQHQQPALSSSHSSSSSSPRKSLKPSTINMTYQKSGGLLQSRSENDLRRVPGSRERSSPEFTSVTALGSGGGGGGRNTLGGSTGHLKKATNRSLLSAERSPAFGRKNNDPTDALCSPMTSRRPARLVPL